MSVDLRRFRYDLEPVLRMRTWELEAVQARLGRALRELEEARRTVEDLRERYREQGRRAAEAFAARIDPCSHPRVLAWLARLRESIAGAERAVRDADDRRAALAEECVVKQRRVEALERHRGDHVEEFAREEGGRLASDADREWLARRHWSGTRSGGDPTGRSGEGAP